MQKKLLAATLAATIGMGGSALAADVYSGGGMKDAPVYVAPTGWAGFYIGANLGGMIDDNDMKAAFTKVYYNGYTTSTSKFGMTNNGNKDEPIGGVHIGYNFQNGNIVYGIESDVNFADNIDYLATIRGRLGYAMGPWLLYATGGAAFISFDNDVAVTNKWNGTSWSFHDNRTETGYVVGGGVERKIAQNISFGVEGLYYNFDNFKSTHSLDSNWCREDFVSMSRDENFWTVRARLTYHFPAFAEYTPLK